MRATVLVTVAAVALAAVSIEGVSSQRADASTCPTGRVYLTSSGVAANDAAIRSLLEDGTGLCVTIGVEYADLDATVDLTAYDSVYLQANYNYGSAIPDAGATAILDHVAAGGGLVTAEWSLWQVGTGYAGWTALEPILPVTYLSWYSPRRVRFSRLDRPADPILDREVSADFVFEPSDAAGTFSRLGLKPGATAFYVATGTTSTTAAPPPAGPLDPPAITVGMAGWEVGSNGGRVFSFATTNGAPEIGEDANLRRLILNALGWVGGVVVTLAGDIEEVPPLPSDDSPIDPVTSPGAPPVTSPGPIPAGESWWSPSGEERTALQVTSQGADLLRLEAEGLTVTLRGAGLGGVDAATVSRAGEIECEVCRALAAGSVIEVWMFSEPRLLAAHLVDDLPCQRFTIPLVAPLDGHGPVDAGAHVLQILLPTAAGMDSVALGMTVSEPRPTSVPAGDGPEPAGRAMVLFAGMLLLAVLVRRRLLTG